MEGKGKRFATKFINKSFKIYSLSQLYRYFIRVNGVWFIPLMKKIFKPDGKNRKINLGAGRWYFPKWENIDWKIPEYFMDYEMNFNEMKKLPFDDNSTEYVFSSHLFEHLTNDVCNHLFKECHRIIKKDGVFRIGVPDMELAIDAYKSNCIDFFDDGGAKCLGKTIDDKFINFFFTNHEKGHCNIFYYKKLKRMLEEIGFYVERKKYGESDTMMKIKIFDYHPVISLYVEGKKELKNESLIGG